MKKRKRDLLPKPKALLHDPIEQSPAFQAVIGRVRAEAESLVDPALRVGRYAAVEREIQRILLERYGIEWKTADEMNPGWDFV